MSASYRQVVDLGNLDRSASALSTGQSGQPGNRFYFNMIEMWREAEYHPMLWSRDRVEKGALGTQTLAP